MTFLQFCSTMLPLKSQLISEQEIHYFSRKNTASALFIRRDASDILKGRNDQVYPVTGKGGDGLCFEERMAEELRLRQIGAVMSGNICVVAGNMPGRRIIEQRKESPYAPSSSQAY